ncbi:MAG TPA: OsmC family protein [Ktedonobacterales bacterium]
MGNIKTAQAEYRDGMRFDISAGSGHSLTVDVSEADGGQNAGFSPMELPLVALLGCIGMDVVSILKKKRQQVTGYAMSARGVRAETHPQVFVEITVEHTFTGHGIEQAAVDRALELASTRYCSVSAMLGKTAEIVHTTRIVEAGVEAGVETGQETGGQVAS